MSGYPNALIIGTMRGGTTSLFRYLTRHSRIRGPVRAHAGDKEVNFFDREFKHGLKWYGECFPAPIPGGILIEASPGYLIEEAVPKRVASIFPDRKFMAVLRDPTARAWSHYCHYRDHELRGMREEDLVDMAGRITPRDAVILDSRGGRPYPKARIFQFGFYAAALARWYKYFDPNQIKIIISERFFQDPSAEILGVLEFLGLPAEDLGPFDNVDALRKIRPNVKYPKIPQPIRQALDDLYIPQNAAFERLTGIETGWPI